MQKCSKDKVWSEWWCGGAAVGWLGCRGRCENQTTYSQRWHQHIPLPVRHKEWRLTRNQHLSLSTCLYRFRFNRKYLAYRSRYRIMWLGLKQGQPLWLRCWNQKVSCLKPVLTFNIDDRWCYNTALVAIPVQTTKKGIFVHHQNITEVLLVNVNSRLKLFDV